MKIQKKIIDKIYFSLGNCKIEKGGILGGYDNVVSVYEYDQGISNSRNMYIPNVHCLNVTIQNWYKQGIDFFGLIHTHFDYATLSYRDVEYARLILSVNNRKEIFMPILFIKEMQVIGYKVTNTKVEQCRIFVI